MQLNERIVEKAEIVKDASIPKGILARVWYPIMRFGVKNANKRKYDREVADTVLMDEAVKHKMATRTLFGNQEHPELSQIKLDWKETSHIVSEFKIDEANKIFYAAFDILPSEPGKFINGLLEAGCLVGVSTRADGELEEAIDEDGSKYHRVVPGSYKFQTVDFTGDPSTPNALPEKIIHSVKTHYEAKTMDKKTAIALLEYANTPESRQLLEAVQKDDSDVTCKCTPTEAGHIITCECKTPVKEATIATGVPRVGAFVKVNEKAGVIAHLFPRTKKAIVQFTDCKETVKIGDCVLVEDQIGDNADSAGMDTIAQKLFGRPYSALTFQEKEQVVDAQSSGPSAQKTEPDFAPADSVAKPADTTPIVPSIEPVPPPPTGAPTRGFYQDGKGELLFVDKVDGDNVSIVRQDGSDEVLPLSDFNNLRVVKSPGITDKSLVGNATEAKEYFEMRTAIREANDPKKEYHFPEEQEGEEKREVPEVAGEIEEARIEQYIADNWNSFTDSKEAVENVVTTFKVTETVALAVFAKCVNENRIEPKTPLTVETLKEHYVADALSYGKKVAELNAIIEALREENKTYLGIEERIGGTQSIVEQKQKEIVALQEKIVILETYQTEANGHMNTLNAESTSLKETIDTLREHATKLEGDLALATTVAKTQSASAAVNEATIKTLNTKIESLKESHKKDLIKIFVESRVSGLGLKLPKSTLALLEACNTVDEVNSMIRQAQDALREGITHSVNLSEIKIADSGVAPTNPMQQRIDRQIENALKNFNI